VAAIREGQIDQALGHEAEAWRIYRVRGRFRGRGIYIVTFAVINGKRFGECTCQAGQREQE
jgi:hypothetical protein